MERRPVEYDFHEVSSSNVTVEEEQRFSQKGLTSELLATLKVSNKCPSRILVAFIFTRKLLITSILCLSM